MENEVYYHRYSARYLDNKKIEFVSRKSDKKTDKTISL